MEQMMIDAIQLFMKEHKDAEIRSVSVVMSRGGFKNVSDAAFRIEDVDDGGWEKKSAVYFSVNKARFGKGKAKKNNKGDEQ